jgi:RLL motif-containing protein 1
VTTFIVLSEPLRTEKSLDLAAIVMKMKYILDLRELQNEVNGVLAKAQEFTADPRTDSKLGKLLFVESDSATNI